MTQQQNSSINIGGNVSGSNVNIGGTQTIHGNLNISNAPAASDDVQTTLKQQIDELTAELDKLTAEHTTEVEKIKLALEDAIAEAEKAEPSKSRLQIRGDSLKQAAENIATVAPIAVKIAKTLLLIG